MEQIMCMVSSEAKEVLIKYQREGKFAKRGDALEALLLQFEVLIQESDEESKGERDE